MLYKSLEFKHVNGQKVKIVDIPFVEESNSYHFMLGIRLQSFISKIYAHQNPNKIYSFKEHLKRVMKWKDYEQLFNTEILKHNA